MARRTSQRGPLSRAEILTAALDLAERDGLDMVSLHKVADAVGVATMSLYNHVADKNALLDGMADVILAGMLTADVDAAVVDDAVGDVAVAWEEVIRELAHAFRAGALRYPRSAPLVLTRRMNAPAALPLVEAGLAALARSGLAVAEQVRAVRAVIAFLVGSLMREVGTAGPPGTAGPAALVSPEASLLNSGLPHVSAAAAELAGLDHAEEFEYGLDLLVSSIRLRQELSV